MSWWRKLFKAATDNAPANTTPTPSTNETEATTESLSEFLITANSKFIKAEDMKAFGEIFCDGYELTGSFTLDTIAAFIQENKGSHPNEQLFATLDNFDQACYTFGHACGAHLKEDSDEKFPWPELTTSKRFLKRKDNFEEKLKTTTLDSVKAQRLWRDNTHDSSSLRIKAPQVRERKSYIQVVPVEKPYEALIAFPNGYFTDDYSPFENYRIAEYLYNTHEIELFGIGANYMGFISQSPIVGGRLKSVSAFISSLYSPEARENIMRAVSETLSDQTLFYVCYTDI